MASEARYALYWASVDATCFAAEEDEGQRFVVPADSWAAMGKPGCLVLSGFLSDNEA